MEALKGRKPMTLAERIFVARMLPHLLNGVSIEAAGRAVLKEDEDLHRQAMSKNEVGEEIRSALCTQVYEAIRAN